MAAEDIGHWYGALRARVRALCDERGLTQEQLGLALGVSKSQVSKMLNGRLGISAEKIYQIAEVLDVDPGSLVSRRSGEDESFVPLVGYVGGGGEVYNFGGAEIDRVEAPPNADDTLAVIVRGDSMAPRYVDGTVLFYRPSDAVPHDCIGRTCVVELEDGRSMVKLLRHGSAPGLYRLVSLNMSELDDVRIKWASRVLWTKEP